MEHLTNVLTTDNRTPLHLASESGNSETVELLIEKGESVKRWTKRDMSSPTQIPVSVPEMRAALTTNRNAPIWFEVSGRCKVQAEPKKPAEPPDTNNPERLLLSERIRDRLGPTPRNHELKKRFYSNFSTSRTASKIPTSTSHGTTSRFPSSWEIWRRWLNLELDEMGCLETCAERLSQEDALLREQIERYNQQLLELEDEKRS
ncbi:hypothetical protein GEV33_014261 [Tenebrio molitor]|uniref:Uncharacterized protein n=1 Tax=Tenebrio molitor TaxID=7067 RepID=A0A8J6H5L9_TENMO|nr:hypothetical protein GEV33_014261 [Tenebrio molitor]